MLSLESFLNPTQTSPKPSVPSTTGPDPYFAQQLPPWNREDPPRSKTTTRPTTSSDDEDDNDPVTSNTDRDWDNMFYLAEAARLESDGHVGPHEKEAEPSLLPPKRSIGEGPNVAEGSRKRRRKSKFPTEDEFAEIKRNLPLERGDFVHQFADCITLGFCSVEKAREMYNLQVLTTDIAIR
jgi:hypothetical protein